MSLILYPVTVKKNVEINNLLLQRIEPINKGRIWHKYKTNLSYKIKKNNIQKKIVTFGSPLVKVWHQQFYILFIPSFFAFLTHLYRCHNNLSILYIYKPETGYIAEYNMCLNMIMTQQQNERLTDYFAV